MIRAIYICAIFALGLAAFDCARVHDWYGFAGIVTVGCLLFIVRIFQLWRTQ